jgi:hypothetical protein
MHSWLRVVAALVTLPYFCACSLFGPRTQTLTVSSEPPGATVLVNGNTVGNTPLRTQVSRKEDLLIEVRKPGFETAFRSGYRGLSTLGIVDAIGAFLILVPIFGLLSPAAWEQEPSTYGVVLTPQAAAAQPASATP